jgi:hypothetical protein
MSQNVNKTNLSSKVDPDPSVDPDNVLVLDLSNGGRVLIRLEPKWAPTHVERIKTLTRQGFYDGIIFHRVIDGFMAQTGTRQAPRRRLEAARPEGGVQLAASCARHGVDGAYR